MSEDEAGMLARLKSLCADLVQPKIAEGRGRIVKLMGDGLLAEFPSVIEAVQCAVDIQQDMAAREADLPDEQRIRVRIGVNLGDVIVEGSDIYGDGVNIATRLEAIGAPGHVVISDYARSPAAGGRPTAALGWLLLGEALSPLQALGGAAVLAGFFIASREAEG